MREILVLIACIVFLPCPAGSHAHGEDGPWTKAGFEDRTGNFIPADLVFRDERGRTVRFEELGGKPVILTLTYYSCSHICPQMLEGLAGAASGLPLRAGRDYALVTLSFDSSDTPADAAWQKMNYGKAFGRAVPEGFWKFLTGDEGNIRRISEAAGIAFKKEEHGFVHPEVLIFLSPRGRITKYLQVRKFNYGKGYPVTFSKLEMMTALDDASQERVAPKSGTLPQYCFLHEPQKQERFFRIMNVLGIAMLLALLLLFLHLRRGTRT